MATIQIFIQSPHNDPLSVEVDPGSTVKDVKRICNFVGANLRFKGVPILNTDTLSGKGVAGGDTVHAFPANKERSGDAAYQAQQRLGKGKTLRSTAHPYLHQQTQAVVMDTSRRTQERVDSRCDKLEQKMDTLLEHHERVPPSNPDDLELMERVLNRFKVGRMNAILQEFKIERPAGVKREGKAALIVKTVPREQLVKLIASTEGDVVLNRPTVDATSESVATRSAAGTPTAKCTAKVKSGKRK